MAKVIKQSAFESRLNELVCVACDWRLAWDGTGMSPEKKLVNAIQAVRRAHLRAIRAAETQSGD